MDEIMTAGFGCFVGAIGLGVVALIVGFGVDTLQERRAFPAIAACETQRLLPHRQTFGTRVICVPNPSRRDTTGVEVINR